MLSELRDKNKQLKIKLRKLKDDSERIYKVNRNTISNLNSMDNGRSSINSSNSRYTSYDGSAPSGRYATLCDRAKVIRGEASKRIEGLLTEWKEFKDRTDDEIRRRSRNEVSLRELLNHKEREVGELAHELLNMRSICEDQKQTIDRTTLDRDSEAKCRARCVDLESQIAKLHRFNTELQSELKVRTDIIKSTETERESLIQLNSELRHINAEQQSKLEICEHDVTETRMELEILEDMVRALNERKTSMLSNTSGNDYLVSTRINDSTPLVSSAPASSKYNMPEKSIDYEESIVTKSPNLENLSKKNKKADTIDAQTSAASFVDESSSRKVSDRKSAMSALKSLQKEHAEKCNYLAEHIQKLKSENKIKENAITELQTKKNPSGH